jgi:antitoxin YefM
LCKVATLVDMSVVEQMALKDVKNHLSEVVDKVEREHERVVITKHGRPAAVVVSVDDLESLEQTLDILSRPALIKQIRESLDDLQGEGAEALSKDEALALIPRS